MSINRSVRLVLFPLAATLSAASAYGQSPGADGLEEVTVTAVRQPFRGDTPIEELPQSVRLIPAELLQDIGVTELDDVLDLASGIARQNTFGGLWDSFAVRGFAGDENSPTGYLVNGFNNGRGFSGRRDASNIERIEVVKGPGSALYGRTEPGGTMNLVTRKPEFDTKGSVELAAGRFDTYRVAGDFTTGITDSIAFRINGAYEDSNSFRDFITSEKIAATPSILFRIGSSTTVSYELEYIKQEAPFDRGVVAPGGVLGSVPISRFLGEPGDGNTEIEALGHQLILQHEFSNNWMVNTGIGFRNSTFTGFSSDPELVAGRQPFYATGTTLSRQRRFRDYETDDLTARAEISGRVETGPFTHHLLTGVDYYDYEFDQIQTRFRPSAVTAATPNLYSINVFAPVYGQTRTPAAFVNSLETQTAVGIYIQDQIDLTERWKALIGVRYDDFEQEILNRSAPVSVTNPIKASNTATSPRVGLVFDASRKLSLYASFSKGFRPNGGVNAAQQPFAPEFSKSYEIGAKLSSEDQRINATIALYKAEKSNILTADPGNAGFSIAAGEAESKGLELDLTGQLTDNTMVYFSYAHTQAEITKSVLDPNFGLALPAGSKLINIPRNNFNFLVIQGFNVGDGRGSLGAGVTYVADRPGETGVPSFVLPAYTLLNLTGSYAPTESLKITVDVDNLFDKEYYASSYARLWVAPGTPRSYTIRAQYRF